MERTGTFNALADGILNDVAANLGYSREELDRVAREMGNGRRTAPPGSRAIAARRAAIGHGAT
jgi:hypothetical protein